MAMVLDAFASYVQNMLTEMSREELHTLLGVGDEIDKMDVKLGDLKNFLADADKRNITDKSVQEWVGQLKRAMYEAADILDLCLLKAMEGGPSAADVGCFNPLLFCLQSALHAHVIGSRIKALNKRLDTIKERSAAFSFINLGSYEMERSSKVHTSRFGNPSQEISREFDRSGLVGEKIKEDTKMLVDIMLSEKEGNTNIMVVAIVGVGGIGKTTLAQKVFNDETMNGKFDKMIWLSINKDFNKVEMLRTIITLAGGKHGGEKVLAVLQRILTSALTRKKLFLVMDDVWSHGAWGGVLERPLTNVVAPGSRILVTTRDERVAREMKAALPYHHVAKLGEEDAWSLLKKQIFRSETDGCEFDMLKDIGLQIVAKCDCLPLAVKVIGGLLCQKDSQKCDWEMVLNDSIWSTSETPEELNRAVYLSYKDLPSCIKQCFLCYSLLPKNTLFFRVDIIGIWISEGFLNGTSDDLEELGSKYYKELIVRNLIEPDLVYIDQRLCKMHDVIRSFGQFVARDEALAVNGETSSVKLSAHKFLRLSLESKESESDGLDWSSLQAQMALRTLLLVGQIYIKPGDSLVHFPSLRTLHIDSPHVLALVETLHELKHLRYFSLHNSDISSLPDSIGKMKFLQHISLSGCKQFEKLPSSIVNLVQLRYLDFCETSIMGIPKGFCALENLVIVRGFPAHVEGDWCSLEELGPLNRLKYLGLHGLENVSDSSYAAKAKLGEKVYLSDLFLSCGSKMGNGWLISVRKQQQIEKVFDDLCPPPKLDHLAINGYFGRRLPRWMMSSPVIHLRSLRNLLMGDLACCTQLPGGLCQLPSLEFIQIEHAPAIKRIGPEFLQSYYDQSHFSVVAAFPRLRYMALIELVQLEEWEWEELLQAFPVLQELVLKHCKLRRLPPGLASQARALNVLSIQYVKGLICLENFASLVELLVVSDLDLERITNLPRLQKLTISTCPKLKVVEGVPALQSLFFVDEDMETLPEYMGGIHPRHLELYCSLALLTSIAPGESGPEWDKFSHVEHLKAYAKEGDNPRKWYVLYTTNPCSLDTNVSRSFMSRGTLSSFEDAQRFESVFKMTRKTFSYICSLVKGPLMNDMNIHTFVDGRVLSLQDEVAVALIRLNSRGSSCALGYTIGVNESTVLLVTKRFTDALFEGTSNPWSWRDSNKIDNIKSMFAEIHNMYNCCGVICTTNIPFGPKGDYEKKDNILMQVIVDATMRFMNILLVPVGSMNRLSLLHACDLFKECNRGAWLNGSKFQVALDGSKVGEYIIGDEGYPLLPWLLTPYQEENFSDSKKEFNRRHSAATTCAPKALERLKDTWKYLQEEGPIDQQTLVYAIYASCMLHNIVIDVEGDASMPRREEVKYCQEVRQLASEDAVRARDMLAQYFLTSRSLESGGILSSFEDAQRFEFVFKMTRKTFNYVCGLVFGISMEDINNYTFIDGRVMCLEDRVAISLRRLYSSDPSETLGSSIGVDDSTIKSVTDRFISAVCKGAMHHYLWPGSSKMDKIKSMFGRIHDMHNCCGVICTTHIPSGPTDDHEKKDNISMRVIVDPEMRFMDIWLEWEGSMNWSSILQGAELFKECEKGVCLNGSKLKVALDGSEVGEYIIGDAGYPLLPWLFTPYQDEDLSDSKVEFNRRHFATTTCAAKAVARFQDTWKFLQGQMSCPVNAETLADSIYACCMLHNIVIDMEDDAAMQSVEELNYCEEVRQLASEDAVRARDMLSQYFLTSRSSKSGGTLSSFEDAKRFESVFKMTRKAFNYICSHVFGLSMEDINSYTFIDGRVMCLEDRVAVALRRLYSSEPAEILGSSVGVDESTIKLVTDWFIAAVCQRAVPHIMWPDSGKMDKIKSMFGMIHNIHNCCGVICTTHIPFGPICDHEKSDSILMRVIVDPEMRFMEILLEWEGSMNWASNLKGFDIFKGCEMGIILNGSKLKVASDGSEVGEYFIGDVGYPLLPWLLTPYQEEDLSDSKAEFNRRHSAATTCAKKALARFQDTWKFLQGQTSCTVNAETLADAIYACCMLHNIVIDMENDAAMRNLEELNYREEARQLASEDAIRARDMLSQYFWTSMSSASGVALVDAEEDPEVIPSGSGDKGKEQEAQTRTAEEETQC